MSDRPSISIITTCKGRLHHLREALPTWLAQDCTGRIEVIVVDYGCPDGTAEWVRSLGNPRVRVIAVRDGVDFFNQPRARNIGAGIAAGDWLAFTDADCLMDPTYLSQAVAEMDSTGAELCCPLARNGALHGTCVITAARHHLLRGYDELFGGYYGTDDRDYYWRHDSRGGERCHLPCELLNPLDHSTEERTRFMASQDVAASIARNGLLGADASRTVNPGHYGLTEARTLVELGRRSRTDKGTVHSYLEVYDRLLRRHRDTASRVLEIGVLDGESLQLWSAYFSRAQIIGVDLAPPDLTGDRVTTIAGDAYAEEMLAVLSGDGDMSYDIIIDDGPHSHHGMQFAIQRLSALLAPGGTLIVEDVLHDDFIPPLFWAMPEHLRRHSYILDRRHLGRSDDRLLVIDLPG